MYRNNTTICICTRHRPDALRACLTSIQRSTIQVVQVVVSDDSQQDDRRTQTMVAGEFPAVEYVDGPRVGLGANRNRAVREVVGDYVLFLDDDAELSPDFLERMAHFAAEQGVGPQDLISGLECQAGQMVVPHDQSFLGYQTKPYQQEAEINTIVINATLFPLSVLEDVRFDEKLVYGCDEVDVATRARQRGRRIWLNRSAINLHHHTDTGREYYRPFAEASRLYATLKRYWRTERKRGKAVLFAVAAPTHLLLHNVRKEGARGVQTWFRSLRIGVGYVIRGAGLSGR